MGALVYESQLREPAASSLTASFLRIAVNLSLIVTWAAAAGRIDKPGGVRKLFGDGRAELWLRGLFGSLALIASFASVKAIGIGESSFLQASNGVFVALLAPRFLRQKNTPEVWIAIFGALVGLALLVEPRQGDVWPIGRALAVGSGIFSALAYMMIARAGRSNSPQSVIFYFCLAAVGVHLVFFAVERPVWPVEATTWALLLVGGVAGSVAQVFLTKAYQRAPAALCGAVAYLGPVLNLGVSITVFGVTPDAKGAVGAALVVLFGVLLPFARTARNRLR
jgi:S-adenosylmethionine uptake transporter